MVRVLDIETRSKELVCSAIGAEQTITGGIRVGEITTSSGYVALHVAPTRLAGRRFQMYQLDGCAGNSLFSNGWFKGISQRKPHQYEDKTNLGPICLLLNT